MGFKSDVVVWVAKVGERLEYVGKESPRAVYNDVRIPISQGGNMPVRKGNLRNSIYASTIGMYSANYVPAEQEILPDPSGQVNSVINGSKLGDKIYLAFTVAYAVYVNRKYAFISLTSMKWLPIVQSKIDEAKRKFK